MRVISGKAKGRRLRTIAGDATRPTTDRVKESIFSLLGPSLLDLQVLDLFAGSGALGIEALSRGASVAVFVDNSAQAIQVISDNIDKCGFKAQATVYRINAKQAIKLLREKGARFNLVFLDPPYNLAGYEELILALIESDLLAEEARIVVEHDYKLTLPSVIGVLSLIKDNKYGDIKISIFQAI